MKFWRGPVKAGLPGATTALGICNGGVDAAGERESHFPAAPLPVHLSTLQPVAAESRREAAERQSGVG